MKKLMVFFLLCLFGLSPILAQNFQLEIQSLVRSKYVGPNGATYYKDPVIQSYVNLQHKSGIFAEVWISKGIENSWSKNYGDEIDYTLGWNGMISIFKLFASVSYFDNFKIFDGPSNDVIRGTGRIDFSKQITGWYKITPYLSCLSYWIPGKGKDNPLYGGRGTLYSVGVDNEIALSKMFTATYQLQLTRDDGLLGEKPGYLFRFLPTLSCTLSKHFDLYVETMVYCPSAKRVMTKKETFGGGVVWRF
jgi:hypothetical protein